jgi:FkbM family methyltransferase
MPSLSGQFSGASKVKGMNPDKAIFHLVRESIKPSLIVHVGSHEGQEIKDYLDLQPDKLVFIEADPQTFLNLEKNIYNHRSGTNTQIFWVNALVGSSDGEKFNFYRYSNDGLSSSIYKSTDLLTNTWSVINLRETGEVLSLTSRTLQSVLNSINVEIGHNSLLILDVQGAELKALMGLGIRLNEFEFLEVEVSSNQYYEGAPLFQEIDHYLTAFNFQRLSDVPWHGDVVYRKC